MNTRSVTRETGIAISSLCSRNSCSRFAWNLTLLLNRVQWVFPDVHPQYTIALASWLKRAATTDQTLALRGPYASLERYLAGVSKPSYRFPVSEITSWTDTASLPLLPSDESIEVFAQLRTAPRLDLDDEQSWFARPHRELDATNDKSLMKFSSDQPEGFWPIFKGESFDIWETDTGSYYAWGNPARILPELHRSRKRSAKLARSSFHGFPQQWINDPETLPPNSPRIAFRDVTRATDSRTVRAALIPAEAFLTNAAPYFVWHRGNEQDQAFFT